MAAYTNPGGCIIAPSVEAKRLGIKVGMRVRDGRLLCPELVVLPPDPNKYRAVHLFFRELSREYTEKLTPRSIDEFVLDLEGYPSCRRGLWTIAREIKERIKAEIGDWLTVSIGIGRTIRTAGPMLNPELFRTPPLNSFPPETINNNCPPKKITLKPR